MKVSLRSSDELMKIVNKSLVDLPSPSSLSYFWNFGSMLGVFLIIQIVSGLFLSFHFMGGVEVSFDSVIHMMKDVKYGWVMRVVHANGASMFFLLMYFHIGRGLYYGSYKNKIVWFSGVTILLMSMATAFLGYVLPWGQMSFWAATVITNLLSAVPYVGVMLVEWMWGGYAVSNPTLIRFFSFHFLFPFIIVFMVMLHLMYLHKDGSSNFIGVDSDLDKMVFHPYYSMKDLFGLMFFLIFFLMICLLYPYVFMDVENFILSNPLVTPVHIQPEWYFLFAYSILRSIPSKIGGVMALVMSMMVLYLLPLIMNGQFRGFRFYIMVKIMFWVFVINWMLLTWIGACEVEAPYIVLGAHFSGFYFLMYVVLWFFMEVQDWILKCIY